MNQNKTKSEVSILPLLYLERDTQKQMLMKYSSLQKKQCQATQSHFYQNSCNMNMRTESDFDSVLSQMTYQKTQQHLQSPTRIINKLKREKKQINQNLNSFINAQPQKHKPSMNPQINLRDKTVLQKQLQEYVMNAQKNQTYKLSAIHSRNVKFASEFNFQEFQCLDDICPYQLLLKKKLGLNEEQMFRNSMGIEKIVLQRIIRQQMNFQSI